MTYFKKFATTIVCSEKKGGIRNIRKRFDFIFDSCKNTMVSIKDIFFDWMFCVSPDKRSMPYFCPCKLNKKVDAQLRESKGSSKLFLGILFVVKVLNNEKKTGLSVG